MNNETNELLGIDIPDDIMYNINALDEFLVGLGYEIVSIEELQ